MWHSRALAAVEYTRDSGSSHFDQVAALLSWHDHTQADLNPHGFDNQILRDKARLESVQCMGAEVVRSCWGL